MDRTHPIIRVLGPVDVVGAARPFRRAWTLDLVAYLAMHPRGATADVVSTALWPDRMVPDPTRHSTVSAARRSLGRDEAGNDHLPRSNGALRLGPGVRSDWGEFAALIQPGSTPEAWSRALAMVRGRPFDGLRAPDWTVFEGVAACVEDAVVQAAVALAEHHLGAGDGRAAEAAVRQGLAASPYDERLYRALLRSADAQANPAGVESAMAQLLSLVTADGTPPTPAGGCRAGGGWGAEWLAWVHPETARLYRSLSRRTVAAPAPALSGPERR